MARCRKTWRAAACREEKPPSPASARPLKTGELKRREPAATVGRSKAGWNVNQACTFPTIKVDCRRCPQGTMVYRVRRGMVVH